MERNDWDYCDGKSDRVDKYIEPNFERFHMRVMNFSLKVH